jgi:thiol-disulfide isomerase/thioredoxin
MRHFIFAGLYLSILLQVRAQNESLLNFSNRTEKELFSSYLRFEINGHVKDYTPDNNNRFINFRMNKVLGQFRDTSILIDLNGNFHAVLYQPFEGNVSFYYSSGDGYVFKDLYISPGSAISLSINEKKIRSKEYPKSFAASGKFSLTNRLMNDFERAMESHHFITPNIWPDSKLKSDAIASFWNRRMKEELRFFHDYLKKYGVSDPVFKSWEENNIIYTGGARVASSLFLGRRDSTLTYERYLSYFGDVPFERQGAVHNSAYYDFIRVFAGGLEIIENLNPAYGDEKKTNGNDIYPLALRQVDKIAHGLSRDLMYASLFDPRRLAQSTYGQSLYAKNVKDRFIQTAISKQAFEQTKLFAPYDILDRLNSYTIDDSLKTRLAEIFLKHKGRYLFIDFWGSWCGPCMLEMPVYPKFIAHFKDDSIRFLFLSFEMTQQGVEQIQKKYGIEGDFILLSTNEMKILNNVLGFEEYPRHFLVDPGGRVINNNIWSISSGDEPSKAMMNKVSNLMVKEAN